MESNTLDGFICPLCGGELMWMPASHIFACEHCRNSFSKSARFYLSKEEDMLRKKSNGNAAAMREALEVAKKAICHHAKHICQSLSWENSNIQSNCADILCAHRDLCEAKTAINAAISAPPRNCDVGTAQEQAIRFDKFCQVCEKCPLNEKRLNIRLVQCEFLWAQMTYKEGGAS